MTVAGRWLSAALLLAPGTAFAADTSAPLMDLQGTVGVSTAGPVTYSTSIAVPPGTNGMQPVLTLKYGLPAPDSGFGLDWTLGFDEIALCKGDPKIFCMGFNRLVPIKGENGADGTEYRQSKDSFAHIISHGGSNGLPEWFEFQDKTGRILQFGHSADSRGPGRWRLNRAAVTLGNYFTITYGGGAAYLLRVDYSANDRTGLKPYNSIRFALNDGPVPRLGHIRSYAGEALVSDYRLAYDGQGRLVRITRCDAGGNCLAPTSFTWGMPGNTPLLTGIDNGVGDVTSLTYSPSPIRAAQPAAYPSFMMTRLDRSMDGGGTATGTYDYQGDPVYSPSGDFLGFTIAQAVDSSTGRRTSITRSPLDGYGYEEISRTVSSANAVTSSVISEYGHRDEYPGVRSFFLEQQTETQRDLDGTQMPGRTSHWRYDGFGNLLHSDTSWTDGFAQTDDYTYANDPSRWQMDWVLTQLSSRRPSASGLDRARSFQYDPETGALIQDVIEPDSKALRLQADYKYDAFNHRILNVTSGTGLSQSAEKTVYDSRGQFLVSTTDPAGRSENFVYEPAFGKAVSKTDYWGTKESWTYDSFGRLLTHKAGGKLHSVGYAYCKGVNDGVAECPQSGAYLTDETDDDPAIHTFTFYNSRGRLVAVERHAHDMVTVLETRQYDARDYMIRSCKPLKPGAALTCFDFMYDGLGRPVREVHPDQSWTWAYHGLSSTRTDSHGNTITTLMDSQKREILRTVTDGTGTHVTSSTYDGWGNRTAYEDDKGRITTTTYNVRGWPDQVTGPDGRVTSYRYDALGQPIANAGGP